MDVIAFYKELANLFLMSIRISYDDITIFKSKLVSVIVGNVNFYLTTAVNSFKNKNFSTILINCIGSFDIHAAEEVEVLVNLVTQKTTVLGIVTRNFTLKFEVLDTSQITESNRNRFRLWRGRSRFLTARHSIRYYFSHLL